MEIVKCNEKVFNEGIMFAMCESHSSDAMQELCDNIGKGVIKEGVIVHDWHWVGGRGIILALEFYNNLFAGMLTAMCHDNKIPDRINSIIIYPDQATPTKIIYWSKEKGLDFKKENADV